MRERNRIGGRLDARALAVLHRPTDPDVLARKALLGRVDSRPNAESTP